MLVLAKLVCVEVVAVVVDVLVDNISPEKVVAVVVVIVTEETDALDDV